MLLLVVAGLAISAVLPLRTYLEQRSAINALHSQISEERASVSNMQVEAARWQDPVFVRAQARARLRLVAPGETGYIVLDSGATPPSQSRKPGPGVTPAPAVGPATGTSPGRLTPGASAGAARADPLPRGFGDPGRAVAGLGFANPLLAITSTAEPTATRTRPPTPAP